MYSWIHRSGIRILIDDLCVELVYFCIIRKWRLIDTIASLFRLGSCIESDELIIWISPDTSGGIDIWVVWDTRYDIIFCHRNLECCENNLERCYLT